MKTPKLIFCAGGNRKYHKICREVGWLYGSQPNTIYGDIDFVDINYKKKDDKKYVTRYIDFVRRVKPMMSVVPDIMDESDIDKATSVSRLISSYTTECLIFVPKFVGCIDMLPVSIDNVPVRLGYSVPTKYGGTEVPLWEFGDREVHLLGGNPRRQSELMQYLNVVSLDGNMCARIAQYGRHYTTTAGEVGMESYPDYFYDALKQSLTNLKVYFWG